MSDVVSYELLITMWNAIMLHTHAPIVVVKNPHNPDLLHVLWQLHGPWGLVHGILLSMMYSDSWCGMSCLAAVLCHVRNVP